MRKGAQRTRKGSPRMRKGPPRMRKGCAKARKGRAMVPQGRARWPWCASGVRNESASMAMVRKRDRAGHLRNP
jgi:hypothetical protein